jgi:putative endonuclease
MPRNRQPAVYILASQRNGTLYIGVTSNLVQRVWQHRQGLAEGFTNTHGVKTLVWYELHETMDSAITREKALKKWNRQWKLRLIEASNPDWADQWSAIIGGDDESVPIDHSLP